MSGNDQDQPIPDKKVDYINQLYSDRNYSQTEFDKSLILIASGLLAGSFAFIDKIVKIEHAGFRIFLILGWILLALAIGLSSICHFRSIVHIERAITIYKPKDTKEQKEARSSANREIACLNICTMLLILIGSISIILFIYLNFYPPLCNSN